MNNYLQLLSKILEEGNPKSDRTGTGTLSLFGEQLKFDLQKGFPLLTTKRLHFKSIVTELLWLLRGDTNVRWLQQHGCSIWDEWSSPSGALGPVYGHSWRNYGGPVKEIRQPTPRLREGLEATYLGVANGACKGSSPLGKTWEGMISRCYNVKDIGYAQYGGRGVHVCDRWLEFQQFYNDVQYIPGWDNKKTCSRQYVLDKDGRGNGFLYSPETCQWITSTENANLKSGTTYVVTRGSERFVFRNPAAFCAEQGIDNRNFSDLWTDPKPGKQRCDFQLVSVTPDAGVDQLKQLVDGLRSNPDSRRHLMMAWNPADLGMVALPPCHMSVQFYVTAGETSHDPSRLSCHMYQRSCDIFLGSPYNIASYALLTNLLALELQMQADKLVISFGDVHLYSNHEEQAREQLGRKPKPLPSLGVCFKPGAILHRKDDPEGSPSYEPSDIFAAGYNPDPSIKAPVAV